MMMRAVLAIVAAAAVTVAFAKDDKQLSANAASGATNAKESAEQKREADKRDRMIACNKQARDKDVRGAVRKSFVRDCLKDDGVAAGASR
jgi:hypothetical protein